MQVRVLKIENILDTSDDGIQVLLPDGRAPWLPRKNIDVWPGRVVIPAWLYRKIKKGKKRAPP